MCSWYVDMFITVRVWKCAFESLQQRYLRNDDESHPTAFICASCVMVGVRLIIAWLSSSDTA